MSEELFEKVIEMHLIDGNPNGRWVCRLLNWSGLAYKIPRNYVKTSYEIQDLNKPGLYFLFGYDENNIESIYIGEAESIIKRLGSHLEQKENWTEVICFTSKDHNLNKAHIKYLENHFYILATEAQRYTVENKQIPTQSSLSTADQAVMKEFAYYTKLLVNTLGHKVFEPLIEKENCTSENESVFVLVQKNVNAKMLPTSEGYVLLKDSQVNGSFEVSCYPATKKAIEDAQNSNKIQNNILKEDMLFKSASAAAGFVTGTSINGPVAWKNEKGLSLKDFESEKNS